MADVLRCTDQWGRQIVLTDEVWHDHILVDHDELIGQEVLIEAVISSPFFVRFDARIAGRESFYRPNTLSAPYEHLYLKVCVEFSPAEPGQPSVGRVITAFPAKKVPRREVQKWP